MKEHTVIKLREYNTIGIYYLYRRGVLVYIGQSKNIFVRIENHKKDPAKNFDSFSFEFCKENLLDSREQYLINKYQPEYNHTHSSHGQMNESQLKRYQKAKEIVEINRQKIVNNQSFTDRMIDGW